MRERLIELIDEFREFDAPNDGRTWAEHFADHLLANGVVILDPQKYPPVKNAKIIRTICGVSFDEAAELIDAKREGRIIVSPVELGSRQRVYIPIAGTTVVYNTKVYGIGIDEDGDTVINPKEYPEDVISINGANIGKTVFLSREEAEKALEERSGG